MVPARFAAATIFSLLAACAGSMAQAVPQSCSPESFRVAKPATAGVASADVPRILQPKNMSFSYAREFIGPCAPLIRASRMGAFQLIDGRVFGQSRTGEFGIVENVGTFPVDEYDKRFLAERLKPTIDGESPIYSARVQSRLVGGDYVGLWRVGRKWLVRSFSLLDDRSFTTPQPLLESHLPLRSITYFPSPDAPCGKVELVQEKAADRVVELSFFWCHHSTFKRST